MGEKLSEKLKDLVRSAKNPEEELIALLKELKFTLSTAESCTGGLLSSKLVGVPGASEVFREGYITYCNKAKRKTLDVSKTTIRKEGAISAQTAKEMAAGAAMAADTDIAVSVTGNAGPSADEEKPVGLVYIGLYFNGKVRVGEFRFEGTRNEIREKAAEEAVRLLWKAAMKYKEKNK